MERFTISLDDRLAEQFDAWMTERRYANRSEAVRDLLRAEIGKTRHVARRVTSKRAAGAATPATPAAPRSTRR